MLHFLTQEVGCKVVVVVVVVVVSAYSQSGTSSIYLSGFDCTMSTFLHLLTILHDHCHVVVCRKRVTCCVTSYA